MSTPDFSFPRARSLLSAFTIFAATVVAGAQTPAEPPRPSSPGLHTTLAKADSRFLIKAALANSEALAIARIAATRSGNPHVREFAQEVIATHEALDGEIARLAEGKMVTLDAFAFMKVNTKWSDKKATGFDDDFVRETIAAHKSAVSLFEDAAQEVQDPDVAALARDQRATLTEHLRMAEDLKKLL